MPKKNVISSNTFRPPIVVVVGHVDHGKTTLLDTIRKTHVADREHGGITQHIGAYQIQIPLSEKSKELQTITFIDTPGHEAFSKMRSRGANIADIAILVVGADDSVMPQTIEAISQVKAANVPMIVALNKIDLETANPEKVKKDLAKNGVQVEGYGGDVPIVPISAKVGTGVQELLDMIILMFGMQAPKSEPEVPLEAVVIETRLDKGKGMIASVIVQKGTLKNGTTLYTGNKQVAKVRALLDDNGTRLDAVGPSTPVEILGFTIYPQIGTILRDKAFIEMMKVVPEVKLPEVNELPDFLKPLNQLEPDKVNIVIKADTAGSMEAILASLDKRIKVVFSGVGVVNETDILMAKSTNAFVIGFNVKATTEVEKLAQTEKVVLRTYTIIYELLEELSEVVNGIREVLTKERELGKGVIIAEFPFDNQKIAGTKVTFGRLARGDTVKIMRGEEEVAKVKIKSIRLGKEEKNKVDDGSECGVLLDKKVDFQLNDAIIAFTSI
jgi:translation initiation factor IF-2